MKIFTLIALTFVFISVAFGGELIGTVAGEYSGEQFGTAIGQADFNDDSYSDLVVSAPASDENGISSGKVYIFYGGPSADLIADKELFGATGSFFGMSLSSAGDFNNDGCEDLIVGAPYYEQPYQSCGAAYIFYGGANPDTIADHIFTGLAAGDFLGIAVAGIGDFNGDSYSDITVGSYKSDWGGNTDAGKVYIFYGGPDPDFQPDKILIGIGDEERFGYSITGADFNHDSYNDIAVGAYSYDNLYLNQGRIYIFAGGLSPDSIVDLTVDGSTAGNKFGWALTSGNTNGDNFGDLIMGTDGYNDGWSAAGKMYLYSGNSPMNLDLDDEFTLSGLSDNYLGYSIASGVDINADGYDEIMVGMPGNDDYDTGAGGAVLLSGGLSLHYETTFFGTTSGEELGKSVGFWKNYGASDDILAIAGSLAYENYRGRIYVYKQAIAGIPDCGDINNDHKINLLDITFLIVHIYRGGPAPAQPEKADVNYDGQINLLDITYLINYLYKGGPNPKCS